MLLAAAGRIVTAESIVDALWGEDRPVSASGTLQSYVSRLRRQLEKGEQARLLLWESPGYRLAVDAADVDFRRFEALADQGRALLAAGGPMTPGPSSSRPTRFGAFPPWWNIAIRTSLSASSPAWRTGGWPPSRTGWRPTWPSAATPPSSGSSWS